MQKAGTRLLALAALGALVLVLTATAAEAQECFGVEIVPRSGWGARAPRSRWAMRDPRARYVFIHHTTGPQCYDKDSCSLRIRGHQNYHMDTNGWPDIGYSFLVGGDGKVYEGRGWGQVGAHTKGYNTNGIAISFVGDFSSATPNNNMLNATKNLIACGVRMVQPWSSKGWMTKTKTSPVVEALALHPEAPKPLFSFFNQGKISSTYSLHGHRDANWTACPGNRLYNIIKAWVRYGGQLNKYR